MAKHSHTKKINESFNSTTFAKFQWGKMLRGKLPIMTERHMRRPSSNRLVVIRGYLFGEGR